MAGFVAITEKAVLAALYGGDIAGWAPLQGAAGAIAIVVDRAYLKSPYHPIYLEDCGACAQNILLAAHAMGLGGCWLGAHPIPTREARALQVLGIPDDGGNIVFCLIALGYPAAVPTQPQRWDETRVQWETW